MYNPAGNALAWGYLDAGGNLLKGYRIESAVKTATGKREIVTVPGMFALAENARLIVVASPASAASNDGSTSISAEITPVTVTALGKATFSIHTKAVNEGLLSTTVSFIDKPLFFALYGISINL